MTKQACYLLPTLEWESGLQRWRARALSPDSRAGKTICLCTLFTEFNPFSVSSLSKIQSTVWLYWSSKKFWLQLEGFHLMGVSHLWRLPFFWDRGYLHSTVFLQQPKSGWHKTNITRDLRFPLHSFHETFIQTWHSIFHMKVQVLSFVS